MKLLGQLKPRRWELLGQIKPKGLKLQFLRRSLSKTQAAETTTKASETTTKASENLLEDATAARTIRESTRTCSQL